MSSDITLNFYKPKICLKNIYLTRKKRCCWLTFRRVIIGDKEVTEVLGMKIESTWEGTHGHSSANHACTPWSLAFSPLNGPTCLLRLFWVCNQGVKGSFGRFSFPYHFDESINVIKILGLCRQNFALTYCKC